MTSQDISELKINAIQRAEELLKRYENIPYKKFLLQHKERYGVLIIMLRHTYINEEEFISRFDFTIRWEQFDKDLRTMELTFRRIMVFFWNKYTRVTLNLKKLPRLCEINMQGEPELAPREIQKYARIHARQICEQLNQVCKRTFYVFFEDRFWGCEITFTVSTCIATCGISHFFAVGYVSEVNAMKRRMNTIYERNLLKNNI